MFSNVPTPACRLAPGVGLRLSIVPTDHAGAVVGPAAASLFLYFHPGGYRSLFALTIIPGALDVRLIFFAPEGQERPQPEMIGSSTTAARLTPAIETEPLPGELKAFLFVVV